MFRQLREEIKKLDLDVLLLYYISKRKNFDQFRNFTDWYSKKNKKSLAIPRIFVYNQIVVTLIAVKREVAVPAKAGAGFPWSECQVVKTGDKSLYEYYNLFL